MFFDNAVAAPADDRLRTLETTRVRLLDAMLVLRCDCADVFADPRRTGAERDEAALELAHAVGLIQRCDDELHALREQSRSVTVPAGTALRPVVGPAVGPAAGPAVAVTDGWFR